ncbi:hypothetical protein JAAARDRAFT_66123 [Jaapia argillacea MUCL 33604]|uniref:Borealin N-terminal domain-containing protein n=1 Tax=Jaapia argillacea MUCL 33604 TaxID=933084 RepID=A0A067Q5W7_9AGAM|nr:hypothetical protein JAAARDRAFT_66123 [Jaapia argillacea MUCL 33604]
MEYDDTPRKYTPEEKEQLIANLDLELEHRTRQLQAWLNDTVENFRIHAEGIISRIPKQVRNMTIGELADKYNGDTQAAMMGLQRERTAAETDEIAKSARKRKWEVDSNTESKDTMEVGPSKAAKNARFAVATPNRKAGPSNGPGTAQRVRGILNRTPGPSSRVAPSQSPAKSTRFASSAATIPNGSSFPRTPSRPTSPVKSGTSRSARPPSSATFNPSLPPKAPTFPPVPRWPRKDEHFLSVNGSPLANPWWDEEEDAVAGKGKAKEEPTRTLKRVNSIIIRKDPSFSFTQPNGHGQHSRSNSQSDAPSSSSQSQPPSHTRVPSGSSQPSHTLPNTQLKTPAPARALISVPIRDGRILEFDPLQASPGMLEALEGVSESAKKKAKDDMSRLVKATFDKWKIE